MKNYDLLKVVASKLNGLPYGLEDRTVKELDSLCKDNGVVICFGQSDDLMELRGIIDDEYGCYDGGTICIDEKGNADADVNVYYPITAVWAKDNISWQYEFEPKHEVFNIYEDAEIYCKGIVFFVDDLKRNSDGIDEISRLKAENEDMHGEIMSLRAYIDNHEEIWKSNAHIENERFVKNMQNVLEIEKEQIYKDTAKKILDEVSKHVGGGWLVELYEKYGLEA